MTSHQPDAATLQVIAQLKEHFEAVIEANDRRYALRDEYRQEALRVAFESNDRRLETMNEFRAALTDQSTRMITRAESETARHAILEKAEQGIKATNARLDAEIGPLNTKLDEVGRPNWALLASLISITFVMIAGIWLVIGLKIDSSLIPVSLSVENMKVAEATVAETTRSNTVALTAATQSTLVGRADRAQLDGRVQILEQLEQAHSADRRANEARTQAQLIEIETQFKSASVVLNIQKDDTQRLLTLLWQKVFPGASLPSADYRPNLYRDN